MIRIHCHFSADGVDNTNVASKTNNISVRLSGSSMRSSSRVIQGALRTKETDERVCVRGSIVMHVFPHYVPRKKK